MLRQDAPLLFAHHAVSVGVVHMLISRVSAQDSVYRIRLGTVDGKTVLPADLDGPVNVPASVQVGEPLGRVVVALLVAVDAWRRQREVQEVRGELRLGCRAGGA